MRYLYLAFVLLVCSNMVLAQSANRNVLLETSAGTWGGFNPDGEVKALDLINSYAPGVIQTASYHNGDDLESIDGASILSFFGVVAFPTGAVDRTLNSSSDIFFTRDNWAMDAAVQINAGSVVNVSLNETYDPNTRLLNVTVNANFTDPTSGNLRFHCLLIEDSLLSSSPQANFYSGGFDPNHPYFNAPNPIPNYQHRWVFREALSDVNGDAGIIPSSVTAGDNYSSSYSFTLPNNWNENRVKVIGFVARYSASGGAGNEVLNVAGASAITPPPSCTVDYTFTPNGAVVDFVNNSTGSASFSWDFDDGNTSTAVNPQHTYSAPGTYQVKLLGFDAQNQPCDSMVQAVTVSAVPCTVDFSFSLTGQTATFSNTSSGPASYSWDFGDGSTSFQTSPTHTYSNGGAFWATLRGFDDFNQECGIDSQLVSINQPCTAAFNFQRVNNEVTFTNTSIGGFSSQEWDFGDGSSSSLSNPVYIYPQSGDYQVCLTLRNDQSEDCAVTCNTISIFPTGQDELAATKLNVSLSPNPVQDLGIVSFELERTGMVTVSVLDMMGREVEVLRSGRMVAGLQRAAVNATALTNGVYFVRVQTGSVQVTKRLVVQH